MSSQRKGGENEREGDKVRRRVKVPLLVRPERARGTDTRLHLVDDEEDAVLLGQRPQRVEERRRRVVVTALCARLSVVPVGRRRKTYQTG